MTDEEYDKALAWRRIYRECGDKPCSSCSGSGVLLYGSTSTWQGGIGGAMMTEGLCDKCWGSGNQEKPWVDLRRIMARLRELQR